MWISWSWRIKRTIFTNNMIEVGSIMTSDLLIKLCGHRLYSVSPSLDQLTDESATHQIGRSWFWGTLSGNLLYRGEAQVSTCRMYMYMQGQRRVLCPLDQGQWRLYLRRWNEFSRKSTLGRAGIIMAYLIILLWFSWICFCIHFLLEKLSFLLAMAMRFVNECDNKISIIKLMRW